MSIDVRQIRVESETGDDLGPVTPLDTTANLHRKRQRPEIEKNSTSQRKFDAVEMAYQNYSRSCGIQNNHDKENN
jgi:hypothetical protein